MGLNLRLFIIFLSLTFTSIAHAGTYTEIALKSCEYLEGNMPIHTECMSKFLNQTCDAIRDTGNLQEAKKCYEDTRLFLVVRSQELQFEAERLEEERKQFSEDTARRIEALRSKIK